MSEAGETIQNLSEIEGLVERTMLIYVLLFLEGSVATGIILTITLPSLPTGQLLNDTQLAGCDLWLLLDPNDAHRIECLGACAVRVQGEFANLALLGQEMEVNLEATLLEAK